MTQIKILVAEDDANIRMGLVDTLESLHEAGDLVSPLEKGILQREQCHSLVDLISGRVKLAGETRFFKSVGMAAFDLYGARLVYEKENAEYVQKA